MKVLLVVDHLGPGGSQRQIVNLAVGLASSNHKVTIFTYYDDNHYRIFIDRHNIDLVTGTKRSKFDMGVIFGLRRLLRAGSFDIHCSFLFTPNTYLLLASSFGYLHKTIVSERTFELGVPKWYKYLIRRIFYRKVRAVVVNSEHQLRILESEHPSQHGKFRAIPNGVMLDDFKNRNSEPQDGELRILGVGKVSHLKNPRVVIEALDILWKKHHLKAKVKWLGQLYDQAENQNEYYHQCKALLGQYELEDQWQWEGEVLDVARYYEDTDILIHASFGEGFPNAICEALAAGTPVAASRVYDHPNIVTEHTNGYLFDPDDPLELAEKLYTFCSLALSERQQMSRRSRAFAEERFSNEVMVAKFLELFTS